MGENSNVITSDNTIGTAVNESSSLGITVASRDLVKHMGACNVILWCPAELVSRVTRVATVPGVVHFVVRVSRGSTMLVVLWSRFANAVVDCLTHDGSVGAGAFESREGANQ